MSRLRHCLSAQLLLAFVLLLTAVSSAQAAPLQTHIISHADAASLVPVIEPMVGAGSVAAYQGKLIIRASDADFTQIEQTLAQLPATPANLTIELRRAGDTQTQTQALGINHQGVTIIGQRQHQQQLSHYRINTLSGYAASLDSGTLLALLGGDSITLVPLQQGLNVTPLLLPSGQVRLTISAHHDRLDADSGMRLEQATSTLLLTPGEWQPLGVISTVTTQDNQSLNGIDSQHSAQQIPLEVRVLVK